MRSDEVPPDKPVRPTTPRWGAQLEDALRAKRGSAVTGSQPNVRCPMQTYQVYVSVHHCIYAHWSRTFAPHDEQPTSMICSVPKAGHDPLGPALVGHLLERSKVYHKSRV
jgi:hypothetical protein